MKKLEEAFPDLPPISADCVTTDPGYLDPERIGLKRKFGGRLWTSLSFEDLQGEAGCFGFLTPEAFRYYLPAFIRFSLIDPVGADLIVDSILSSLASPDRRDDFQRRLPEYLATARRLGIPAEIVEGLKPPDPEERATYRAERIAGLTPKQRAVVTDFVRFLIAHRSEAFMPGELEAVLEALEETP
ncbi:MAG: DUF6714 family protein [Thermoanaerobaculia bacterium]